MLSSLPWWAWKSFGLVTLDPSSFNFNKSGFLKVYFLVLLIAKFISTIFTKTCLSPSIFNEKIYLWMNACMHDLCYTNGENMVRFKSIKLESRVNTPFGRNYGFICTCISGSTKFPKSNSFRILSGYGTTPGSTSFVRKSRLSVVSRNNQFKTTLD